MQVDWQTLQDLGLLYPAGQKSSVFAWVNFTCTQGGEQRLRERFRQPASGVEEIRETQRAVRFLAEHPGLFEPLLVGSSWLAVEQYARIFYAAVDHPNALFRWLDSWWLRLMNRGVFDPVRAGLAVSQTLVRLAREVVDRLRALGAPPLLAVWMDEVAALLAAPSMAALAGGKAVHSLFAAQVMAADHRLRAEEFAPLVALAKRVYEIDALCSLARATRERGLVFPDVLDEGTPRVEAEGLRHPLLDHPVPNPLHVDPGSRLLFLTGPNMAGKSTYLKAAGIAVFMAQLGMGVPAARFRWTPFGCLFAGIDTTDNVRLGQSYFYREVRRVREVAGVLAGGTTAFAVFDELFKGTNLKDAADACLAVLSGFSGCAGSAFVVASHLSELAEHIRTLDGVAFARFGAEVRDGEPVFRYLLEPGVSDQRLGMLILRGERVLELLDGLRARLPSRTGSAGSTRARTPRRIRPAVRPTVHPQSRPMPSARSALLPLLLVLALGAAAQDTPQRIRFARGGSSAVVAGAVVRGERAAYLVGARAGQQMRVRVTSPEKNAVFQLYAPGKGGTLPGAGETDGATTWSGVLPRTGDYRIVVGGTRGNASYSLHVAIR